MTDDFRDNEARNRFELDMDGTAVIVIRFRLGLNRSCYR